VGGYAVVVFVVLQLMDAAVEPLRLPDWLPTLVVLVLILGFPVAFVLAWQFDITGQGLRRTEPAGLLSRGQSFLLFSSMFVLTAALGFGFYQYYSGVFAGGPTVQQTASAERDFSAPENSIAVLPFTDLSEGGDQASFSDGMAEEILNLLAQVDGLRVAARTSSFAFRGRDTDIREIGRALNVSTVLEGSVRTAGNRIRLTAQLINVEDGYHIWSQTYDRERTDVFSLQDEVASAIASELVDSFAGLSEEAPPTRTASLAAFEAYRTGRLHWWRRSPAELQTAIELFAKALEEDPAFAPAYAAIADSWILLSLYGNVPRVRAVERDMPMIEKALALDPESAEAYAALGLARMEVGQLDAAESSLRQAVRLNEDYIPARLWLANLLDQLGRLPEQGIVLRDAMALDPLNELLAINYAYNLNARGQPGEARALLEDLVRIKPESLNLLRTLSGLMVQQGDLVAGWEYARRALDLEPEDPLVSQAMANVWMELGEMERAEELLADALEAAGENAELQSQYFMVLAVAGRFGEAERVNRELFGTDVETLPVHMQRRYHSQLGFLRLLQERYEEALAEYEQVIDEEPGYGFKGDQLFALTIAAKLHREFGEQERYEDLLAAADRFLERARLNGVDNPEFHYAESVVLVLKGREQDALEALQTSYDRGWRQAWVLDIDGRLDPLRPLPGFQELQRRIDDELDAALATVRSRQVAAL
jgi:TolB-like protein/tetratricopeptide (TPR) repeat protein